MRTVVLAFVLLAVAAPRLHADAAVLLAEPYGGFGGLNPTGHAAVYLSRICAASPTHLRRCSPGEHGAVISRYYNIAGYDWLAVPLLPYLYAVERAEDVPESADSETVALLRNAYRQRHLLELAPDSTAGEVPGGEWYQLVGAAYDRKIYAFEIETTEAQDEAFIREFNSRRNESHFNLLYRNCADFTRSVINFYFPRALTRSIIADLGITTPKRVAKRMVRYSKKHPQLDFHAYVIPQIPGNRPPSKNPRGVLESLVRSKKYAVPLVALNVWLTPTFAAGYITVGRFNPDRYAKSVYGPVELEERASLATQGLIAQESSADTRLPGSNGQTQQSKSPAELEQLEVSADDSKN